MSPHSRTLPVALTLLALAMFAPSASAQIQIPVQQTFHDGARYSIRNVRLQKSGNTLVLAGGGQVKGSLDLNHHCTSCGGALNQVIIGLAGSQIAQSCLWSGGQTTRGWKKVKFTVDVPDAPGIYELRARYAQSNGCGNATQWWQVDKPGGPDDSANIAVIVVDPPLPASRDLGAIYRDIVTTTNQARARTQNLRRVTASPKAMNSRRSKQLAQDTRAADEEVQALAALHYELGVAMGVVAAAGPSLPEYNIYEVAAAPQPQPPVVVVVAPRPAPVVVVPPALRSMSSADFGALMARLRRESWEENRLKAIGDVVRAGALLDRAQARELMGLFKWDESRIELAVLVCGVMIEDGALPELIAAIEWESSRDTLRKRVSGQCRLGAR